MSRYANQLDRRLARHGEEIALRRRVGTTNQSFVECRIPAIVKTLAAEQMIGGLTQINYLIVVSPRQRGYSAEWERESKAFLLQPGNGTCSCGCGRHADMVDHRIAAKGDPTLFWDRSNWQPMNRRCNSRKAASTEGGFGNPITGGRSQTFGSRDRDRGVPNLGTIHNSGGELRRRPN